MARTDLTAMATALDITDIMGRAMRITDPATIGRVTITDGKQEPGANSGFFLPHGVRRLLARNDRAEMPVMRRRAIRRVFI
jgi:hypothetical protein